MGISTGAVIFIAGMGAGAFLLWLGCIIAVSGECSRIEERRAMYEAMDREAEALGAER